MKGTALHIIEEKVRTALSPQDAVDLRNPQRTGDFGECQKLKKNDIRD